MLRDVAKRTCTCYWSDFPDLTMSVNPSSHAAACPYHSHSALYEEFMAESNKESRSASGNERREGLRSPAKALRRRKRRSISLSSSSSSSSYSVEAAPRPSHTFRHRATRDAAAAGTESVLRTESPVAKAAEEAHEAELQHRLQERRRRWLAEEDAAGAKKVQGRAAVMGSTKRRTYMEQLMSAASDTPTARRTAEAGSPKSTAVVSRGEKRKQSSPPRATQKPLKAALTPSPTHIEKDAEPHTTAEPATPPPSLLPDSAPSIPATSATADDTTDTPTRRTHSTDAPAVSAGTVENEREAVVIEVEGEEAPDTSEGAAHYEVPQPATVTPVVEEPPDEGEEELTERASSDPLRALSRPRTRPTVGVPGPGAYHADAAFLLCSSAATVRGAALSRAARMPPITSITPGPGAYNLSSSAAREAAEEGSRAKQKAAAAAAPSPPPLVGEQEESKEGAEAVAATATQPGAIGRGVVFSSTGARQFQLDYGLSYQRNTTWAKREAALPGPGAYNIVDGDRLDQSRPIGVAKQGFQFAKSAEAAHFTGLVTASTAASPPPAGADAALVVPWRDWAGGAYIGTATTAFWAHPSLAGGGRRTLPRRGDAAAEEEEDLPLLLTADTGANAVRGGGSGSVWHGVGSGVALRLTSQRFPEPATSSLAAAAAPDGEDNAAEGSANTAAAPVEPRGEPGPASYETASALRFIQRRAPEVSMTFKHDRGPRGPLQSTTGADEAEVLSGVPGPGSYDVTAGGVWGLRRSPQWSFGTSARLQGIASSAAAAVGAGDGEDAASPGPGAYSTDAAYRAVQPAAASAVVGVARRFSDGATDLAQMDAAAAAGVSAGGDVMEGRVGPGTYDLDTAYGVLHGRVRGGVVPRAGENDQARRSGRGALVSGDTDYAEILPGPGSYSLPALSASGPTAFLSTTSLRFPWERLLVEDSNGSGAGVANATQMSAELAAALGVTPGPGAYDVAAAAAAQLANRPGAVIGRAPRSSFLVSAEGGMGGANYEVGPGSYTLPALPAGRSVVLPRGLRERHADGSVNSDIPGPGLYDPVDRRVPEPRTFTLARTSARFPDAVAEGRGAVRDAGPGPGAYETTALLDAGAAHGVAFGTAARFSVDNDYAAKEGGDDGVYGMGGNVERSLVGPGSYDPYPASAAGARAPSFSIPRGPRFAALEDATGINSSGGGGGAAVGPGAYEVVDLSPPTRSAVMGSAAARPPVPNGDLYLHPGPGAYSPQYAQVERSVPHVVLAGTGHTTVVAGTGEGSGLGPGHYDPQHPTDVTAAAATHGYAFGSAPRVVFERREDGQDAVPGPGAYEARVTRDGHSLEHGSGGFPGGAGPIFGTAPRLPAASHTADSGGGRDEVPGPGAYMPEFGTDMGLTRGTAAHIGTAPRSLLPYDAQQRLDTPGPGAYAPEAYADMGRPFALPGGAAAHRIGTAPRSVGESVAGGMTNAGPGPGAYDPNVYSSLAAPPAVSFPRAEDSRTAGGAATADTPGPGAYAPNNADTAAALTASARAIGFGSAARFPAVAEEGVAGSPGPSAYAPEDAAVRAAAVAHRFGTSAGHLGAQSSENAAGAVPGPGAYDVDRAERWLESNAVGGASAAGGGALRFGTAARFESEGDAGGAAAGAGGVGPGAYDVLGGLARSSQMPNAAVYSFGRAPAHASESSAVAGTAAGAVEGVPGPGSYSLDDGYRATLPRTAAANFAGRVSASSLGYVDCTGEEIAGSGPGPGAYDLPPAFPEGPQWGFGSAAAHAAETPSAASERVGPGSYAVPSPPPLHGGVTMPRAAATATEASPSPGPGAYDVAAAYRSSSNAAAAAGGVRIGTAPRYAAAESAGAAAAAAGVHSIDGTSGSHSPGPGAYSPNVDALSSAGISAAARVGPTFPHATRMPIKESREEAAAAAAVGPGTYEVSAPLATAGRGGGFYFGTAPRLLSATGDSAAGGAQTSPDVGPGRYAMDRADAQVLPRAPAHHIALSRSYGDAGTQQQHPGPGSYDVPVEVQAHARAAHLLGRPADDVDLAARHDTPGPGSYNLPGFASASLSAAAAHSFGTAPTHRLPVQAGSGEENGAGGAAGSPGPGAYDSAAAFAATQTRGSSGGVTIQGRAADYTLERRRDEPGPGAYDVSSFGVASGSGAVVHGFGTAPRMPATATEYGDNNAGAGHLGPGAYDTSDYGGWAHAPSISFTQAARMHDSSAEAKGLLPGPGAYDVGRDPRGAGPSFTIPRGLRPELRAGDADSSPMVGPGSYSPTVTATTNGGAPAASFGNAPRVWATGNVDTPGPGSYAAAAATGSDGAHAPSFGTSQRPDIAAGRYDTPGPGAYAVTETAGRTGAAGPTFAAAVRPDVTLNHNPGPGTYELASALAMASGGGTFGSAVRPGLENAAAYPGPGAYDHSSWVQAGRGGPPFGSSSRPTTVLNDNPGPGTYSSLFSAPDGPAPSFGIGERLDVVSNAHTPGPGAYHVFDTALRGTAAGFGYGEQRPSPVTNTNPGPGTYHREAYIAQLTDVPHGFGRAERPDPVRNTNPGPGSYYREAATTAMDAAAPSFATAPRPSAVLNANPGPGTYYKENAWDSGLGGTRAAGFALSERPDLVLNRNPGPGTYHREYASTAEVAGGFGKAERMPAVRGDGPGPGTYFRGVDESDGAAAGDARGMSFAVSERPDVRLNDNPGPGAYFPSATPMETKDRVRTASAQRRRSKRPTAAETLQKLASCGYPLDQRSTTTAATP